MSRPSSRLVPVAIVAVAIVALLLVGAGCSDDGRTLDPPTAPLPATTIPVANTIPPEQTAAAAPAPLALIAPWPDGAVVPARYTCDGDGVSPALTWTGVPEGTAELAITVTDLDAGQYVHWFVDAIDASRTGLSEGLVPDEAIERSNSAGVPGWESLCPPAGAQHRYQFTVHALNQQLELADEASAAEAISVLNLIAIDQGSVTGTVARSE